MEYVARPGKETDPWKTGEEIEDPWGVLSSIVLRAWESHVQGEGLDGST
jgi:hypothetical protein